ncbi:MAG: hypothetical protein QOI44_2047 [Actinomycetota bacterium]|nr:hypothetical protein [Actinomycetota bacterium]
MEPAARRSASRWLASRIERDAARTFDGVITRVDVPLLRDEVVAERLHETAPALDLDLHLRIRRRERDHAGSGGRSLPGVDVDGDCERAVGVRGPEERVGATARPRENLTTAFDRRRRGGRRRRRGGRRAGRRGHTRATVRIAAGKTDDEQNRCEETSGVTRHEPQTTQVAPEFLRPRSPDAKGAANRVRDGGSCSTSRSQTTRTFWASSPFLPGATSNSTR